MYQTNDRDGISRAIWWWKQQRFIIAPFSHSIYSVSSISIMRILEVWAGECRSYTPPNLFSKCHPPSPVLKPSTTEHSWLSQSRNKTRAASTPCCARWWMASGSWSRKREETKEVVEQQDLIIGYHVIKSKEPYQQLSKQYSTRHFEVLDWRQWPIQGSM
jgi:hypothetical protein